MLLLCCAVLYDMRVMQHSTVQCSARLESWCTSDVGLDAREVLGFRLGFVVRLGEGKRRVCFSLCLLCWV